MSDNMGVAILFLVIMGACIFAMSIRLGEALDVNGRLQDQVRLLQNATESYKSQLDKCTANNVDMANKLLVANGEIDGLKAERDQLVNDCNDYADELHECRNKLDAKTSECRDLTSRLDQSVRERGDVVAANTKLHAELRNVKEASGILNAMHQEALDRNEELMAEVDELKKRLSDTQTLKNQTQEQLDSYAALSDELKEQLAAASGSCDYLLDEVDRLKNQVAGFQRERSEYYSILGQRNALILQCYKHVEGLESLAATLREWHGSDEDMSWGATEEANSESVLGTLDVDTPDGKPWGPFSKADFASGEANANG